MSTKLCRLILSVLCGAIIVIPNFNAAGASAFSSNPTEVSDISDKSEDKSPSKAVSALVIITIFTVTCAGSAVLTFKLRKKAYDKKHSSDSDSENADP